MALAENSTYLDLNNPISAISNSPDYRHILVGGRDVLKVIRLNADGLTSEGNLRTNKKKSADLIGNDVRWHQLLDNYIATASTNGAILVWDLKNIKSSTINFRHSHAVNRICWNPVEETWLMSAGQDGVCKLWDVRCNEPSLSFCSATSNFRAQTKNVSSSLFQTDAVPFGQTSQYAIRDVQFDPFNPLLFATGVEDGSLRLWDVRKNSTPYAQITAHIGLVMSVQYNPIIKGVVATGGRDRLIKVWSLHNASEKWVSVLEEVSSSFSSYGSSNYPSASLNVATDLPYTGPLNSSADSSETIVKVGPHSGGIKRLLSIQTTASVGRLAWRPTLLPFSEDFKGPPVDDIIELMEKSENFNAASESILPSIYHSSSSDDETPDNSPADPSNSSSSVLSTLNLSNKTYFGNLMALSTQMASSASVMDTTCYVWDIRSTSLPVASWLGHKGNITGLLWIPAPCSSTNTMDNSTLSESSVTIANVAKPWLLSAGKDNRLILHSPSTALRTHTRLRTCAVAFGLSSLAVFSQSFDRSLFWDPPQSSTISPFPTRMLALEQHGAPEGGLKKHFKQLPPLPAPSTADVYVIPLLNTNEPSPVLAARYALFGAAVSELCLHNASRAAECGRPEVVALWRTVAQLYAPGVDSELLLAFDEPKGTGNAPSQRDTVFSEHLHILREKEEAGKEGLLEQADYVMHTLRSAAEAREIAIYSPGSVNASSKSTPSILVSQKFQHLFRTEDLNNKSPIMNLQQSISLDTPDHRYHSSISGIISGYCRSSPSKVDLKGSVKDGHLEEKTSSPERGGNRLFEHPLRARLRREGPRRPVVSSVASLGFSAKTGLNSVKTTESDVLRLKEVSVAFDDDSMLNEDSTAKAGPELGSSEKTSENNLSPTDSEGSTSISSSDNESETSPLYERIRVQPSVPRREQNAVGVLHGFLDALIAADPSVTSLWSLDDPRSYSFVPLDHIALFSSSSPNSLYRNFGQGSDKNKEKGGIESSGVADEIQAEKFLHALMNPSSESFLLKFNPVTANNANSSADMSANVISSSSDGISNSALNPSNSSSIPSTSIVPNSTGSSSISDVSSNSGAPITTVPPSSTSGVSGTVPTVSTNASDFMRLSHRTRTAMAIVATAAEIGDVQSASAISHVIGSAAENAEFLRALGPQVVRKWLLEYISLLHRQSAWSISSYVIAGAADDTVRRFNQISTSVTAGCLACGSDVSTRPETITRALAPDPAHVHRSASGLPSMDLFSGTPAIAGISSNLIVQLPSALLDSDKIWNSNDMKAVDGYPRSAVQLGKDSSANIVDGAPKYEWERKDIPRRGRGIQVLHDSVNIGRSRRSVPFTKMTSRPSSQVQPIRSETDPPSSLTHPFCNSKTGDWVDLGSPVDPLRLATPQLRQHMLTQMQSQTRSIAQGHGAYSTKNINRSSSTQMNQTDHDATVVGSTSGATHLTTTSGSSNSFGTAALSDNLNSFDSDQLWGDFIRKSDIPPQASAICPGATTKHTVCDGLPSKCVICEEPVRSVYVWCQGCGHGGHLSHMSEWFAQSRFCPSGCMHICNLRSVEDNL